MSNVVNHSVSMKCEKLLDKQGNSSQLPMRNSMS